MGERLKNVVFFRPLSLPSQCLQGLWITFLFTDAEAGEDPAQQIIGAECTGYLSQQLLRLTEILCQQLPCPC
jgi:hypothetical protein